MLARSWTVFANIFHIPPEVLELAVGITGLAVFLRPESTVNRVVEPKSERVEGAGTSNYWGFALNVLCYGWCIGALFWLPRWSATRDLELPTLPVAAAAVLLAMFIETLGHEFGHLVAGHACGQTLRLFHIGPFTWSVRNGSWKFEFSPRQLFGGSVAMVPVTLENYRVRKAIGIAGGPAASLIMGITSLLAVLAAKGSIWEPFWFPLAMLAAISFLLFLANLIPQRTKRFYSDGAQLYQVLSNGPWAKVHLVFGMATASTVTQIRPRDWDINLINEAAQVVTNGREGMIVRLMASHYHLDAGLIPEALANVKAAESLFNAITVSKPADFYAEFVFVNAVYAHDLGAAEDWWLKLQALNGIDYDADYWRARASVLWLRGELEDARQAWERGNELAAKLPVCGLYDFTRSHFGVLRKILADGDGDIVERAAVLQPGHL
jgi:hypothetical protein